MIISILIFSYCFGNISPAIILSKLVLKSDIRSLGSGNAGATNVKRVMGSKFGLIVFVLDMVKGMIPVLIGSFYGGAEIAYLCGVSVVLGHVFPAFLNFKGGKGVATSFGAAMVLDPIYALISIAFFGLIVWRTKYVSLGSMLGTCVFPILNLATGKDPKIVALSFVFAIIIIIAHRNNIKKLLDKTESKITR
ncbi:MAG: glycerol-3-phosphate 1-O-acyltransferase PlsY [Peptostreptococcaceae bacterium]|nr:glycerol-3-phosphate 1-O-acyltransferase PlsY [Peptostreptococcaceae bacterium]